jgi:hypothetical protein
LSHPATRQLKRKTDFFHKIVVGGSSLVVGNDDRAASLVSSDHGRLAQDQLIHSVFADFANDQRLTTNN